MQQAFNELENGLEDLKVTCITHKEQCGHGSVNKNCLGRDHFLKTSSPKISEMIIEEDVPIKTSSKSGDNRLFVRNKPGQAISELLLPSIWLLMHV